MESESVWPFWGSSDFNTRLISKDLLDVLSVTNSGYHSIWMWIVLRVRYYDLLCE